MLSFFLGLTEASENGRERDRQFFGDVNHITNSVCYTHKNSKIQRRAGLSNDGTTENNLG